MTRYGPYRSSGTTGGAVLQSGTPSPTRAVGHHLRSEGMLAGVVVATYVPVDGEAFPDGTLERPASVYCDVLVYSSRPGMGMFMVGRALVANTSNLHDGRIWKPRAAKLNLQPGETLDIDTLDPRDMDGDHVLIQFLEDNVTKPIIVGMLPHPRAGLGNDGVAQAGHRELLKVADGDPDFWKKNGTWYGVDKDGNFVLDATRAHAGEFGEGGVEEPAEDAVSGNVILNASNTAKFIAKGVNKDGSDLKFLIQAEDGTITLQLDAANKSIVLEEDTLTVKLGGDSVVLENNGATTTLTVGTGAVAVAIADHLETLYTQLKAQLDQLKTDYGSHSHSVPAAGLISAAPSSPVTGSATSAPPSSPTTATFPSWDSTINSTKVTIPDG